MPAVARASSDDCPTGTDKQSPAGTGLPGDRTGQTKLLKVKGREFIILGSAGLRARDGADRQGRLSHPVRRKSRARCAHRRGFFGDNALVPAQVDVRVEHGDAVASGVFLERFQVVKAHGLLVEDGHEELQRVIALEPGGLVGRHSEGEGVRFREHVLTVELFKYPAGRFLADATLGGPGQEPLPVVFQQFRVVLPPEGPAQAVRIAGGEPGQSMASWLTWS